MTKAIKAKSPYYVYVRVPPPINALLVSPSPPPQCLKGMGENSGVGTKIF